MLTILRNSMKLILTFMKIRGLTEQVWNEIKYAPQLLMYTSNTKFNRNQFILSEIKPKDMTYPIRIHFMHFT
jgi:hypothetical protein